MDVDLYLLKQQRADIERHLRYLEEKRTEEDLTNCLKYQCLYDIYYNIVEAIEAIEREENEKNERSI